MRKQGKQRKNKGVPGKKNNRPKPDPIQTGTDGVSTDRRRMLRLLGNAGIAAAVVGGVGYYTVSSIQASISEADLGKIGNGRPAIVQIHDPNCGLCRTLQSQTRGVLDAFDAEKFEYLVANIKTRKGSDLAIRYSVPHVTLLLFDPNGEMVRIVRGPVSTPNLRSVIAAHLNRHG